jgi:hypothetical protein
MARVKVCGECRQPVADCVCPPDEDDEPEPEDDSED